MKMYKTGSWKELIEEVEVERATDKSVWINGLRSARDSRYIKFFNTKEEAKEYLASKYEKRIQSSKRSLKEARDSLKELLGGEEQQYIILSTEPRVNYIKELVQVLVSKEFGDVERLFIATIGFGDLECYLDDMGADVSYSELLDNREDVIEAIAGIIEACKERNYSLTYTPYYEPTKVIVDRKELTLTDPLDEHPYGFIPVEEYDYFIY